MTFTEQEESTMIEKLIFVSYHIRVILLFAFYQVGYLQTFT